MDAPFLFRPIRQTAPSQVTLILRAPAAAGDLGRAVPALIATLDRDVPVSDLQTMESRIAKTLAYPTFRARLLGGFAGLALLLAVAGLYGVLSQLVAQRTQEIGIRVALGAQRSAVLALVAKQGALLAGTGLVAGIAIALWLGRFLESMLYGIRPTDPTMLALVSVVLASAAVDRHLAAGPPGAADRSDRRAATGVVFNRLAAVLAAGVARRVAPASITSRTFLASDTGVKGFWRKGRPDSAMP